MRKIKLKNKKNKSTRKIIKFGLIFYILIFIFSLTFTVKQLINNKNINEKDFVDYLIKKTINKKTDNYIIKESIKLISNIDVSNPKTLLSYNDKSISEKDNKKIIKDAKASEDNYNEDSFKKITSFIDEKNKNEEAPLIYLYNSHQLETYSNKDLENDNISPNVLMVSYLLKDKLNNKNISTIVENTNISEFIKISNLSSDSFYASTRIFLKNVMNKYPSLKLFIDIHRDSVDRNISVVNINKKDYARILFVLGTTNKNYKENENVMNSLDSISDKLYPGLSRGIYKRPTPSWPDSYNQDLKSSVILIEVGGKDNKIDEVLNTIDALSEIIDNYMKGN